MQLLLEVIAPTTEPMLCVLYVLLGSIYNVFDKFCHCQLNVPVGVV
jgi:hypothetical protein